MSCVLLSEKHISFILSYACERETNLAILYGSLIYWDVTDMDQLQELAEILFKENIRAWETRSDEELEEEETLIQFTLWTFPLNPLAVVKACRSYLYQIAETDDYETTVAYYVVDTIMHDAIMQVPGYDEMDWFVV